MTMDPAARRRKKILEARRLRDVSASEGVAATGRLIRGVRKIAEAADRARL